MSQKIQGQIKEGLYVNFSFVRFNIVYYDNNPKSGGSEEQLSKNLCSDI